ncbi:YveK family protein [Lederbergia wuyishanensis]|uniref:Capsular polysaccharide biosynthesis protein n=1 Tax=Lederbergia wuyishanensis TaxID=1347903 RepID=A0ABU0D7S0_9BACI|nr:capsular biosynthesis protein [Lederbergia wuyishanensis]MCJ8009113.1 capsular biosynthesis protein [Lederbergia wuyishanensis]MDQ0344452.1 capsular polysaccharide biosynthesis protein [Lederbergia wuyishanensis]
MNRLNQMYNGEQVIVKEINLKEVYKVILKRWWVVLLLAVITTIAGWIYSQQNKTIPLYETSANIIINANAEYRKTLQVIIKDTIVLEKVIKELGLERSPSSLASQITVSSIDSSQVVSISVVDSNPQRAVNIANTTATVFIDTVPKIIDLEEVKFLSEAKLNETPITVDNGNKIIIAAFILGILVGLGLIFLIDSLDDSIKSEREIETILGVHVLGSISTMNKKNLQKRKSKRSEFTIRGETIGSK